MGSLKKGNEAYKRGEYKRSLDYYLEAKERQPHLRVFIDQNIERLQKYLNDPVDLYEFDDFEAVVEDFEGCIDNISECKFEGWVLNKSDANVVVRLKIFIDGIFYGYIGNEGFRKDLLRLGKSNGIGGFSFNLPYTVLSSAGSCVQLKLPNGKNFFSTVLNVDRSIRYINKSRNLLLNEVSIIVPVFNAVEDLKKCIFNLMKYTNKYAEIIIINDASTDPDVVDYLNKFVSFGRMKIFHNEVNLGFTKSINKGIDLAGTNDVVLLNSDARVTPRWLEGLKIAASIGEDVATVTPMSDRAGVFSAPNLDGDNKLPINVLEEDYAIAFRRTSSSYYPTVPTGNGFCMYIKRKCILEIGSFDAEAFPRGYGEENDFCMRARANGWRNVIDDRTYVFHAQSKSFGFEKESLLQNANKVISIRYPDYSCAIKVFVEDEALLAARFNARKALLLAENGLKPRVLYVISTLTGGTPYINKDLMSNLSDSYETWLLKCDSINLSLSKFINGVEELVQSYILSQPVNPLTHSSSDYDSILTEWISTFDFDILHVRHIAWHSVNLLKIANTLGCRVIKSFHDYYEVCPSVKLIDNANKYCGGVCSESKEDCSQPLWAEGAFPQLKNNWVYKWRSIFVESFNYCHVFVTTSQSAKETILRNLNLPNKVPFHVIQHGRDFLKLRLPNLLNIPSGSIKILIPGNIDTSKGLKIIENLLKADELKLFEIHILGFCDEFTDESRVVLHGQYRRDDFIDIVSSINPHVGLIPSIWDETWCHTLTEVWASGLPSISFDFPTISERVSKKATGWIIEKDNIFALRDFLYQLTNDKEEYLSKLFNVIEWQESDCIVFSAKHMANQYSDVYKDTYLDCKENIGANFYE